jgi:type IX secretion system PorP/SprF family membrane protein
MKRITLLIAALSAMGVSEISAQNGGGLYDPVMTMYHYQPLEVNPALAGNMDSKWRMNAVYREQGYSVSRPYRTFEGQLDMQLPINAWSGNIWGFGLSVLNDDQGDSYMRNSRINGSFSLGQYLDARMEHSISIGFQGGLGSRAIDYTDTYWDRQWVGEGFDLKAETGEPQLNGAAKNYADLSTGLQYTYYSGELVEFTGGLGVYHVNRPDVGLYKDADTTHMQRRTTFHADFSHKIRDNSMFAIKPSVMYSRQAKRAHLQAGTRFQFLFNEGTRTTGKRNESSITFGIFTRASNPNDNISFNLLGTMAMEFAGFTFGGGYEVPLANFQTVNGYEGAFEFMIGYRAGYQRGLYNKYSPKKKGKL